MSVKRTIRSSTVRNAFKNFLVPIFKDKFFVVTLRCLWDVQEQDINLASYNIDSKRDELESIVNLYDDVVAYFSCTCAMQSSILRKELKKTNGNTESDQEYQQYEDDDEAMIPGTYIIL